MKNQMKLAGKVNSEPLMSSSRRRFLTASGAVALGTSLGACSNEPPEHRYNDRDIALLAKQRADEASQKGKSRFGEQRYQGYRGLAKFPWFELDSNQQLVCVDDAVPMSIDMHAHLGMSVLFKPDLDLQKPSRRVQHLLDCDGDTPACELDLDVYVNSNFTPESLDSLEKTIVTQGLWGSSVTRSHTIPNLIAEMNAMRVEKSAILPIKLDLPFGDDQTEQWRAAVDRANQADRLLTGFSVHPLQSDCIDQLREHAKRGFKLMKLHPTVQRFYPDDPAVLPLYEEAQSLGVSIFFHGGRAGIEPDSSQRYAMPRHYRQAFEDFPKLQFVLGHAGGRDADAMLELMLANSNVWLGTHGQSVSKLDSIIQKTSLQKRSLQLGLGAGDASRRILFGTDWPFYHIGASLSKALIVTDSIDRSDVRNALLRDNALELIAMING